MTPARDTACAMVTLANWSEKEGKKVSVMEMVERSFRDEVSVDKGDRVKQSEMYLKVIRRT